MRIFIIFLLLLILTGTTFAQVPVKQLTEREKIIFNINREIENTTVIELLRKYNNDILKSIKDKEPLPAIKYASFTSTMTSFVKYRWFIADTGLSKKWLKSVRDLLAYMRKTQSYIESAEFSGNTQAAKYQQAVKYFDTAYQRFVKLVKKPVKVSAKLKRQVQAKKVLWQKAMRKKYKIKEKYKKNFN